MKKFNWQIFISFNLLFTFVVMVVSGLVLYFKPEGSVARWIDWKILFLSKTEWESLHTIFSILFMVFAFFHILKIHLYNIFAYLSKRRNGFNREFYVSLLITIILFLGSIWQIRPVHSLFSLGNSLSDAWEETYEQPQDEISARSSLKDIAIFWNVSSAELKAHLVDHGWEVPQTTSSLIEIAEVNHSRPYKLYQYLEQQFSDFHSSETLDLKKLTLGEAAFILDMEMETVFHILQAELDVTYHSAGTTVRQVCEETGMNCEDISSLLTRKK